MPSIEARTSPIASRPTAGTMIGGCGAMPANTNELVWFIVTTEKKKCDYSLTHMDADQKDNFSRGLTRIDRGRKRYGELEPEFWVTIVHVGRLRFFRIHASRVHLRLVWISCRAILPAIIMAQLMTHFEVAIVGAGPAGSFAGERLARAGVRVAL